MLFLYFKLSYHNSSLWLYDGNGKFLRSGLPLIENDPVIAPLLTELQRLYEGLFVETEQVFEFIGFQVSEEEQYFTELMGQIVLLIQERTTGKYRLKIDLDVVREG